MGNQRTIDPELMENIDHLESNLLKYEAGLSRGEDDTSLVQYIFRFAHNLKSHLGMLGFTDASRLIHHVESCFDLVRNAKKHANTALTKSALTVVDILREHVLAPEGTALPDTTDIMKVLEAFTQDKSVEDMTIELPFPLDVDQALAAMTQIHGGRKLHLMEALISSGIKEDIFAMLPCFEQAAKGGTVIAFHPPWNELPPGNSVCVLRILVATSLGQDEFAKAVGSSTRPVKIPVFKRYFVRNDVPPDAEQYLQGQGYLAVNDLESLGSAVAIIGARTLQKLSGQRRKDLLLLGLTNLQVSAADQLKALDKGIDAIALDLYSLEKEVLYLESLFLTGFAGSSIRIPPQAPSHQGGEPS